MATKSTRQPDASQLTEAALSEAALSYLNRYDATVAQLRKVLLRRLQRYGSGGEDEAESVLRHIDAVLHRFVDSRLLDDRRFAEGFCRAARQRGLSALRIRQKLRQRGVGPEVTDDVLGARVGEEAPDLAAARAYVRKRRLLRRFDLSCGKQKQKALAALARQGFPFQIALDALGQESDALGRESDALSRESEGEEF